MTEKSCFNKGQIKFIEKKFNLLSIEDENGVNVLPRKDGLSFMKSLAQNPSEYDYQRALDSASLKYKDNFSWTDVVTLVGKIWKNELLELFERNLLEELKKLDYDSNGYIDERDFVMAMKMFGETLSASEFDDIIDLADVKDGKINYYDFIKVFSEI